MAASFQCSCVVAAWGEKRLAGMEDGGGVNGDRLLQRWRGARIHGDNGLLVRDTWWCSVVSGRNGVARVFCRCVTRWWFCVAMIGNNVNGSCATQFQAHYNGGFVVTPLFHVVREWCTVVVFCFDEMLQVECSCNGLCVEMMTKLWWLNAAVVAERCCGGRDLCSCCRRWALWRLLGFLGEEARVEDDVATFY